jgi:hypothetical protein
MELSAEAAVAVLPVVTPTVRTKRRIFALGRRQGIIFLTMTALLGLGFFCAFIRRPDTETSARMSTATWFS